jgi:hypothetical protein
MIIYSCYLPLPNWSEFSHVSPPIGRFLAVSVSNAGAKNNHHGILIHNFEIIWQQIRKLMQSTW